LINGGGKRHRGITKKKKNLQAQKKGGLITEKDESQRGWMNTGSRDAKVRPREKGSGAWERENRVASSFQHWIPKRICFTLGQGKKKGRHKSKGPAETTIILGTKKTPKRNLMENSSGESRSGSSEETEGDGIHSIKHKIFHRNLQARVRKKKFTPLVGRRGLKNSIVHFKPCGKAEPEHSPTFFPEGP